MQRLCTCCIRAYACLFALSKLCPDPPCVFAQQANGLRAALPAHHPFVSEHPYRISRATVASSDGDACRCPDEADAQALRAAVLMDELKRPSGRRAQVGMSPLMRV